MYLPLPRSGFVQIVISLVAPWSMSDSLYSPTALELILGYSETGDWGYNNGHKWGSPLAQSLDRMKSIRRSVRAEWARCIAPATRD